MNESKNAQRRQFTQRVMFMLRDWGLSPKSICAVLVIPGVKPRHIERYYHTENFPNDPELDQRIEHLIGIAEGLYLAYPRSSLMASHWLNLRNRHLGNRPPLDLLLSDGVDGMVRVRAQIDCAFSWNKIDSAF